MKNQLLFSKIIIALTLLAVVAPTFGQFRTDAPHQNIRESITGGPVIPSLLDAQNFQMNHSFSMSMMNMGGMSVGVGAYTNSFSLALTPKMSLNTQVSLVQPTMGGMQNQGNVFYGVGLNYKASENSFLSFQINNYPTYYQRPNQHLYLIGY
jgi:hypothetical protein